jgi:pyroglutamyl-peptidase
VPTKVLVSGFEPFGGSQVNPSQLLVQALEKENFTEVNFSAIVLPVEFTKSSEMLLRKIKDVGPDVVISFGQAEGRSGITPEKVAINFDDARIPDNSGDKRTQVKIDAHGPDAYFSTLPVEKIVEALKEEEIPTSLSLSAGAFVCNHLFYSTQNALKGTGIRSGFIHLPLVPEQQEEFPGQPTMDLATMVRGARTAILSTL